MTASAPGRSFAADPIVEIPAELPLGWAAQLVSCVVDENVGLPDAAVLMYRDPDHDLLSESGITLGTPLKISVVTVQDRVRERLFTGEVTAIELDHDTTGTFTVIRALSKAHRLQRGRKVVAYRNMKTADIVRKVAAGAGLACGKVEAAPITYKQLTQPNVSDWEFLQHLAAESGAQVRVDDLGVLQFTKPKPASSAPSPTTRAAKNPMVLEYGDNLLSLRAVVTGADGAGDVEVRGWNVDTKTRLVAREQSVRSTTVIPGMSPTVAAGAFGAKARTTVADTPYRTQAETTAVAGAVAASVSSGFGEIEAVAVGNPQLRAGAPVALGNVGATFSGRYTATAAHHVLEPDGGYRTTVIVSASPDRSLAGLTGGGAPSRGPRMPGLAIGVVTDIREGKGQRGWVRLKFPWLDDTYVTDWVRTVQWGGNGGGGVFSPEVNDEVLVGFEQGLLDSPYVLGGLYNGIDRPSEHDVPLVDKTSGKVNRRSLVSRSGNRLELLDTPRGPSGVRLASGNKRLEVTLDERKNEIALTVFAPGSKRPQSSVTLSSSGITLDAGTGNVEVKGRSVTINGKTGVTVDGGLLAVLKAKLIRIN
ncbi:VgrG-related protein [Streptomyces microflavus]|jgi:phage protein D|uniref:VgrG-related protein n=3 Tax=Streptomyces microflavus TaxID=1919 RepID=A0A6N9VA95_STRMI|nr:MULTISPECIES: VgrG-related protein [Streptomyces]AGK80188.1 Rhs element Vgr protein [Streptomyces microflavus DSM 40593]MBK5995549.1 VgrG-related protein [Streptomyces sp. MBT58]MBW3361300.1 VgrG-related protein [Streptomyces sp. 09ZI22]MDX2403471.1 VgrG-related protein [Streptomyces microflavus]MDX2975089.1 VgrG-related protein [Streptomyces sp. NRRL_B-2249]